MKYTFALLLFFILTSINAQNDNPYSNIIDSIEITIYNGEPEYLNQLMDKDVFVERIFEGIELGDDAGKGKGYIKGLKDGIASSFKYGDVIVTEINNGISFDYVKTNEYDGRVALLYRLYSEEGLNYHELMLDSIDGELKIVDIYVFAIGETFSDLMKRMVVMQIAKYLKEDKISSSLSRRMDNIDKLLNIQRLIKAGKNEAAMLLILNVEEEAVDKKFLLFLKVQASSSLSEDIYTKTINEYVSAFPDDPSVYLLVVDKYIMEEDWEGSIKSIDKLDEMIGGDDFLNYMRSSIYMESGDLDKAEKSNDIIINEYPSFEDSYWNALAIQIEGKEYRKATLTLDAFIIKFEYVFEDLDPFVKEDYPGFFKSKEYKEWRKENK